LFRRLLLLAREEADAEAGGKIKLLRVDRRWYEALLIDVEKKEKKYLLVECSKHEFNVTRIMDQSLLKEANHGRDKCE
jgi:hypothetical protein